MQQNLVVDNLSLVTHNASYFTTPAITIVVVAAAAITAIYFAVK